MFCIQMQDNSFEYKLSGFPRWMAIDEVICMKTIQNYPLIYNQKSKCVVKRNCLISYTLYAKVEEDKWTR